MDVFWTFFILMERSAAFEASSKPQPLILGLFCVTKCRNTFYR